MKEIWFRRKIYGWGWFPVTWQGWVVVAGYVTGVILLTVRVQPDWPTDKVVEQVLVPVAVLVFLLIWTCWRKGEKPRWQWGKRRED